MTFLACKKEVIQPVGAVNNATSCFDLSEENHSFTRNSSNDGIMNTDQITDPDEEEDFEDADLVTDPDEEEDFEEGDKDSVTDPDEEEDFEEEDDSSK